MAYRLEYRHTRGDVLQLFANYEGTKSEAVEAARHYLKDEAAIYIDGKLIRRKRAAAPVQRAENQTCG